MKRVTVYLPDHLIEFVRSEAKMKHVSIAAYLRDTIDRELPQPHDGQVSASSNDLGNKPNRVPFLGLISEPDLTPGAEIDAFLAMNWADDIARNR